MSESGGPSQFDVESLRSEVLTASDRSPSAFQQGVQQERSRMLDALRAKGPVNETPPSQGAESNATGNNPTNRTNLFAEGGFLQRFLRKNKPEGTAMEAQPQTPNQPEQFTLQGAAPVTTPDVPSPISPDATIPAEPNAEGEISPEDEQALQLLDEIEDDLNRQEEAAIQQLEQGTTAVETATAILADDEGRENAAIDAALNNLNAPEPQKNTLREKLRRWKERGRTAGGKKENVPGLFARARQTEHSRVLSKLQDAEERSRKTKDQAKKVATSGLLKIFGGLALVAAGAAETPARIATTTYQGLRTTTSAGAAGIHAVGEGLSRAGETAADIRDTAGGALREGTGVALKKALEQVASVPEVRQTLQDLAAQDTNRQMEQMQQQMQEMTALLQQLLVERQAAANTQVNATETTTT